MTDPTRLYRHLPDAYDRHPDSDQYKLMAAFAKGTEDGRSEGATARNNLALATCSGDALDRYGENFSLVRPPGMIDEFFRSVLAIVAGGRRGTVAIIKDVLEAATGLTWTVKDAQLDADESTGYGIPPYEVWAKAAESGELYGLAWASYTTHVDGHPEESGVGGPVLDAMGTDGGRHNDHAWGPVSYWTMQLVEKVRPAGVRVVYKDF